MLGGKPHDVLMAEFQAAHRNTTNRRFHAIGIPLLVSSAAVWCLAVVWPGWWSLALVMTVSGLACQFIGHAIEGNRPEVFRDWRFIVIGLEWWWLYVRGRIAPG
jgi:hypothetical protein